MELCPKCRGTGFIQPSGILPEVYANSVQICTTCNGQGFVDIKTVGRTVDPDNDPLAKQIGYKPV